MPRFSLMAATSWLGSLVEGGVDLVGPLGPGVGDEQVAGHREDRERPGVGVEVEDHHHVAVDPVDPLRAQAVGGVLHLEGAPVGGADQEDVLGAGVGPGGRDVDQAPDVEPVDLTVEVPGVAGGPADQRPRPGRPPMPSTHHSFRCREPASVARPCLPLARATSSPRARRPPSSKVEERAGGARYGPTGSGEGRVRDPLDRWEPWRDHVTEAGPQIGVSTSIVPGQTGLSRPPPG